MNSSLHPSTDTQDLYERYVAPTYGRFRLTPVRGQGSWIWDEAGKKYLDFGTGIAVCSLGHAPACLAGALQAQAATLIHCSNLYQPPATAKLARLLVEHVAALPGKVFFCNSGAEANETLYKLARRYGHLRPQDSDGQSVPRTEIITFSSSFHGRTMAGIAATAQEKVKTGFGPLMPGFRHLPFNDSHALREAVGPQTVAILLEAIQGEGGIQVATPAFLHTVADLCREHDLLFLLDEIQCGGGRTGHLRGWESALGQDTAQIVPDAISWAKGMAGGFPFGAAWISNRSLEGASNSTAPAALSDCLGPGSHGTTYGGSPLACAAASAVLQEILDNDLPAQASQRGHYLEAKIAEANLPLIHSLRGLGLMRGLVIDTEAVQALPAFQKANVPPSLFLVDALNKAKLLTIPAGPDVIRLLPALNVSEEEIDTAVFILQTTLGKLAAASTP